MTESVEHLSPHRPRPPGFLSRFAVISRRKGVLPHWECPNVAAFVTVRLGDSLPEEFLGPWRRKLDEWRAAHPEPWNDHSEMEFRQLFRGGVEEWLDRGSGASIFANPVHRLLVEDALHYYDGQSYELYASVVMPNHVHLLMMPHEGYTIASIMRMFKHFVSSKLSEAKSWEGKFWQNEYWDALIRDERQFVAVRRYIRNNAPEIAYDAYEM